MIIMLFKIEREKERMSERDTLLLWKIIKCTGFRNTFAAYQLHFRLIVTMSPMRRYHLLL